MITYPTYSTNDRPKKWILSNSNLVNLSVSCAYLQDTGEGLHAGASVIQRQLHHGEMSHHK